jgi:Holliday junction resolvase
VGLLTSPIITKFFSNKIESSRPEWGDYLLEIADIFSTFDGEDLDRDSLGDRFSAISGRSPYVLRDVSNFRDEFGAYGTYLGLYHLKKVNNRLKMYLSGAAKHFLCSVEPDVESFCRVQMSLFQYPNGAGAIPKPTGVIAMQANVRKDTIREIQNNIRINPFRLICKIVQVIIEYERKPFDSILIPYETLFLLMNDDRINTEFSPHNDEIYSAITEYSSLNLPQWALIKNNITKFCRNFHILDWTGIFKHTATGLAIADGDITKIFSYINVIANMKHDFHGFDSCYGSSGLKDDIEEAVSDLKWGEYYDAFTMPIQTLQLLSDSVLDEQGNLVNDIPLDTLKIPSESFPKLQDFQSNQPHAFASTGKVTDPFETIILREKANREHARILNLIAARIRASGNKIFENVFIDLLADTETQHFIFEIKSNNTKNALSQIRKAVAQLYEYRYRSKYFDAVLCIILQQKPTQDWVVDYLVNDRKIMIGWLEGDICIECPPQCYGLLQSTGIV